MAAAIPETPAPIIPQDLLFSLIIGTKVIKTAAPEAVFQRRIPAAGKPGGICDLCKDSKGNCNIFKFTYCIFAQLFQNDLNLKDAD